MAGAPEDEEWLYHLPEFLDRVREQDAHSIVANLDVEIGGVLYHHRGARVPGHDATFTWGDGTFELAVEGLDGRSANAVFDTDRSWDFFLFRVGGDQPALAWMSDAEFEAEEAETFASKQEAIGTGRFSFGVYLQEPTAWERLEERARETTAPCFIHRPSGRSVVPEGDLEEYDEVLPPELLPGDDSPPDHLGLVEARLSGE